MWFERLMGYREENPEQVRSHIAVADGILMSKVNGATYRYGRLEIPTLTSLRNQLPLWQKQHSTITVSEIIGDIQTLHKAPQHSGAVFQVASQFNLLEMVSPDVTPERGVGIYENDHTQGPACAIACGAGTIYRNYFAPVRGRIGQSADNQIDCLHDIGIALGNKHSQLWKMTNGYALATAEGLARIAEQIQAMSAEEYEHLKGKLQVGVQWDTEVTVSDNGQVVTQVYCAALPVAYSSVGTGHWSAFAQLILEATYEATLLVAALNFERTGNAKLFLTLVGGGAFGNKSDWIFHAISTAIAKYSHIPLEVYIVSYGGSNARVKALIPI